MGLRYVALGDSYTIGTSVSERERWPNQLVARVPGLELVANLGVNGFTSRDLIEVELPRLDELRPELVSVAEYHVEVDITHGPARGRTVCEGYPRRLARSGHVPNAQVGIHLDPKRFEDVLVDAYRRLP